MDAFYETALALALCISFVGGVLIGIVLYGVVADRSRKAYKDHL